MSKKYIDVEQAVKSLHEHKFFTIVNGENWFDQIMRQVVYVIRGIPAADVAEVMTEEDVIKWCDKNEYYLLRKHYPYPSGVRMELCELLSDDEVEQPCIDGPCGARMDEVKE